MSRGKGNAAPAWVAAYLTRWFPSAEKTPNGRPGRDILGTPGVAIEVKTGAEWRHKWVAQSAGHATDDEELAFIVYLPPGLGARAVADSLAVMPLHALMPLLVAAGYAPAPFRQTSGQRPVDSQPQREG
jgi:hypothetical protein